MSSKLMIEIKENILPQNRENTTCVWDIIARGSYSEAL
jgi:hypothetical protein